MSLLNNVVPFTLILFEETRISSLLASILNATTPMLTIIAAQVFTDNEKLNFAKIAGLLCGFVGVWIAIGPDILSGLRSADIINEIACLLAAMNYAFAGIHGRRFPGMNPVKVATGQSTAGTLVLMPFVLLVDHPWTLPMPGGKYGGYAWHCAVVYGVCLCALFPHSPAPAPPTSR